MVHLDNLLYRESCLAHVLDHQVSDHEVLDRSQNEVLRRFHSTRFRVLQARYQSCLSVCLSTQPWHQ